MSVAPVPSKVTSKDGTSIACWASGRGRPLLLVHGTTADHTRWDALRAVLERHATVVAMDRRGRGQSGDTPPYALEREAEDVAAVVDALAAEHGAAVDVFGHSFGALVALEGARTSRSVRKLVLYEPVVLPTATAPDFAERADALIAAGKREEVVELFFRAFFGASDDEVARYRAMPSWAIRVAAAHTMAREDRAEREFRLDAARYRERPVPTLLLLGTESVGYFRESTDALAAALPDPRVATLAGHDHFAIVAAPQLVADAVVPFLSSPA